MKRYINLFIILLVGVVFNCCCKDENGKPDPTPSWKRVSSPNGYKHLRDIEFLNNEFGVICGSDGTVLKTENGGSKWQAVNSGTVYSYFKLFILDENEFFIAKTGLYKTINGGFSYVEIGNLSSFESTIFGIHFFDSSNGLIYQSGWVSKTSDGGQTWEDVYQGGFCDKMQFPTDSVGYISGGATWDGMSYGELHKTVDRGNSWTNLGSAPEIFDWEIRAMYFISKDTGFIANHNREVYMTQDGGITWAKRCGDLPHYILDMVFLSKNEGYGAGYWGILKTLDGGISWAWDYKDETITLLSIAKTPDNKKIIAVGGDGVILRRE